MISHILSSITLLRSISHSLTPFIPSLSSSITSSLSLNYSLTHSIAYFLFPLLYTIPLFLAYFPTLISSIPPFFTPSFLYPFSFLTGGVVARWRVGRSVWHYMLAIALAYFVTLCLYPGIVTEVVSCRMGSWMPVVMMATFNLFDFIGKVG